METTKNSVAESLGEAHVALLDDLRDLEYAVRPFSGDDLAGLRARLATVLAHITEHFRFEERNGYMDVVRKREPRLARTIEQLAEEHGQLRQSLEVVIGQASIATSLNNSLRENIWAWITHVRQHEDCENDLVQDAFNLDISAED